jgi:hypothetical protein
MTQLMEIRKNADSHSRLQNPAGFRTFPTRPDGGRSLTTEHFSTAAIHLSKLDFLSEGWGVPQITSYILQLNLSPSSVLLFGWPQGMLLAVIWIAYSEWTTLTLRRLMR